MEAELRLLLDSNLSGNNCEIALVLMFLSLWDCELEMTRNPLVFGGAILALQGEPTNNLTTRIVKSKDTLAGIFKKYIINF